MTLPIQLISTDFDGTIFAEFEDPPVSGKLQALLHELQQQGAKWVINTGRDMSGLMEAMARARFRVQPDYLVLVEREIYQREGVHYAGVAEWNAECARRHEELFTRIRQDLPRLTDWINNHFEATLYEDPYSPFCLIAGNGEDAELIQAYLDEYCRGIPQLTIVRNDVYARFSHTDFNKGTALGELSRRLGIWAPQVFAAGDHLNDLPMLCRAYAQWLAAPANAVEAVKAAVRDQGGYVSGLPHGSGVAEALMFQLQQATR